MGAAMTNSLFICKYTESVPKSFALYLFDRGIGCPIWKLKSVMVLTYLQDTPRE